MPTRYYPQRRRRILLQLLDVVIRLALDGAPIRRPARRAHFDDRDGPLVVREDPDGLRIRRTRTRVRAREVGGGEVRAGGLHLGFYLERVVVREAEDGGEDFEPHAGAF